MKILYILISLLIFVSCNKKQCNCTNLILPDIYYLEYSGKSRYVCINLPISKNTEKEFIDTEQIRKFDYDNAELIFHFYHEILLEKYPLIEKRENVIQRILEVKFGKILLEVRNRTSKEFTKSEKEKYSEILSKIKAYEYETEVPCKGVGEFNVVKSEDLINIGVLGWTNYPIKKELHILRDTDDYEEVLNFFFSNYDLLKKHLDSDDMISIYQQVKGENKLIYNFNVSKSNSLVEEDGFCGMGPVEFKIECFYKKNQNGL